LGCAGKFYSSAAQLFFYNKHIQMTSIHVQQPSGRKFRISPGYWFVLPAVIFFMLLAIYPAIYVAFLSFFASGKGINFSSQFSFSNYLLAWNSALFGKIISQTFIYAGLATILHLFLGFIIALLLSSLPLNLVFLRASRTVFLIPWAISPTVIAVISRLLLHPQVGPIGIALRNINPAITYVGPLGDPHQALLAVTLTNVWAFTPFLYADAFSWYAVNRSGLVRSCHS
jgi:multiple sugar transport system permease protein